MIIDTHSHYDDKRFDNDRATLLSKMNDLGIGPIVNSASDYESLEATRNLTKEYDILYSTMGIHPSEVDCLNDEVLNELKEYAQDEKCLAIGEIGLDYYWEKDEEKKENQRYWFKRQLELAKELDMPVVIHSRDACEDTLSILKDAAKEGHICDIHCFSYSPEIALEYVKLGFYIGIGGVVTFSNAKKLVETVEQIPLDSILLETDCPYLAPNPFRGERNDSSFLPYVVRKIAKIKGTTEDEVIGVTEKNARKFYRL